MSKTVDERIVEMRFDNKQFESNVQTTMGTLEKLKEKLNFKGVQKGFEDISDAAKKTDLSPLQKGAEVLETTFSKSAAFVKRHIENIVDDLYSMEKKFINSITSMSQYSIENISAGWDKFSDKTTSVATLVSQGFDLDKVNEQLDRLNWFTDETSYNFTDMVKEIGKFTATGQDLEASVTAMEGIASWAALSGQNATKASQAMYQLSQAMSKGALKYDDWKSIQNASMDTVEFRRQAAQAAIDLGMMKQAVDDAGNAIQDYYQIIYQNEDGSIEIGNAVSLNELFTSDYLTKQGWLDTDVMMQVFNQYGKAAKVIQKYTDSFGFDTASEAMEDLKKRAKDYIKTMKAAGEDISFDEALRAVSFEDMKNDAEVLKEATEYMNEFNASVDPSQVIDLDTAIRDLGYEVDEFALKAFEAGQQARTWEDTLNSVKDAVSTGWMNTFQNIFGDYEEAKTLWTDLANELFEVFAESGEQRNSMLKAWKSLGGRDLLFANDEENGMVGAFWNIFYAIRDIANLIKEAVGEVFGGNSVTKIMDLTSSLYFFAQKLRITDETADKLKRTFKGLFAAVDIVYMLLKSAVVGILNVVSGLFGKTDKSILDTTASMGDAIVAFHDWIKENDAFTKAFEKVGEVLSTGIAYIRDFIKYIWELPAVQESIKNIQAFFGDLVDNIANADISVENFGDVFTWLKGTILSGLSTIGEVAKSTWEKVVEFATWAKSELDKIGIGNVMAVASGIGLILFAKKIASATGLLTSPVEELAKLFRSLSGVLKGFSQDLKAHAIIKIAGAIALLAGAVAILAFINPEGLWNAVAVLGALGAGLLAFSIILSKFGSGDFKLSTSVVAIAVAVTILIGAFAKLNEIKSDNIGQNIALLAGIATGITVLGSILSSFGGNGAKTGIMLLGMAASLLLMIHAIKLISDIEVTDIIKAMGVLALLTLMMKSVRAVMTLTNDKATIKSSDNAGLMMLGMAASMLIMIAAIKQIADIEMTDLFKGLAVIAALTLLYSALVAVSKFSGEYASRAGVMMLGMAAAFLIMTAVIKQLASIEGKDLTGATLAAGGILAIFGIITALSKLAGENAAKAGVMMIGMSVAMLAMAGVITILSKIEGGGLARAVASVSALMVLFGALIGITKLAEDCKETLIVLTVDLGLLSIALGALSLIEPSRLLATAASLSMVFIALGGVIASTHFMNADKDAIAPTIVTIAMLSAILAEVGVILSILSNSPVESSLASAAGISMILASMALAIKALGEVEDISWSALAAMGILTAIVAGLAGVLMLLSLMPIESAIINSISLGIMLNSMASALLIISNIEKISVSVMASMGILTAITAALAGVLMLLSLIPIESAITNSIALGIMLNSMAAALLILSNIEKISVSAMVSMGVLTVIMAGLSGILLLLSGLSPASAIVNAVSLSILLVSMSASLLILSAVGTSANAALKGVGVLGVLVAGLGTLMTAIGLLFDNVDGLEGNFDTGLRILEKIGYGLGAFVGNIIGGLAAGITSGLPEIGTHFSEFGENIAPFLDQLSKIDDKTLAGVGILSDMMIKLAAADFIDGITSLFKSITGQSDASSFSDELVMFADGVAAFAERTKDIKGYNFKNIAEGALALSEFANALPKHDGILQSWTGDGYLAEFGRELNSFAPNFVEYANQVASIDDMDAVTKSAAAASAISEFANNLPKHTGALQFWVGESYLAEFGREMAAFAPLLVEYANTVKGLDTSSIDISIKSATLVRDFANALPTHGGIWKDWFAGDATLTSFGEELASFGPRLMKYTKSVAGLDQNAVEISIRAAEIIAAFENTLPETPGCFSFFTGGGADVKGFSEGLPLLGDGLKAFSDKVTLNGGINKEAVNSATQALEVLAVLNQNLPETKGIFDFTLFNGGEKDIDGFVSTMPKFAEGIKKFSDVLTENGGIDASSVNSAANTFAALSEISQITYAEDLQKVTSQLPEIAGDLKSYSDALNEGNGFDTSTMNEVISSVKSLYDLETNLSATGFDNTTAGINELMKLIGLLNRISGLDLERIDAFGDTLRTINESGLKDFLSSLNASTEGINDTAFNIINSLANGVNDNGSLFTNALIALSDAGTQALRDKYSEYNDVGKNISGAITEGIENSTPEMSQGLGDSIKSALGNMGNLDLGNVGTDLLGNLTNSFSSFSNQNTAGDAGNTILSSLMGSFTSSEATENAENAGSDLLNSLLSGFENTTNNESVKNTGSDFISNLTSGILGNSESLTDASSTTTDEAINELKVSYPEFTDTGEYLTKGFANGIASGMPNVTDKAREMARAAADAAQKELEIKSPSRVFYGIGAFAGQGFINALGEYSKASYDSGTEMADSAVNGLSNSVQKISELINADIDAEPTIRPILDLSSISEGVDNIDSILGSSRSIELAAQTNADMATGSQIIQNEFKVDNRDVVTAINDLRDNMDDIADKLSKLQVVLDTDAVVGSLAAPMDTALGSRASRSIRGRG